MAGTGICEHGLSDFVEITDRTVFENYEDGTRLTTYGYKCLQHNRIGTFSVIEHDVVFGKLTS